MRISDWSSDVCSSDLVFTTGDAALPPQEAFAAVRGWGGDWAVTWQDGDAACVRVDVVGDTQDDTDELEDALRSWAEQSQAAEVSVVDGRVRLDSCVGGAGAVPPQVGVKQPHRQHGRPGGGGRWADRGDGKGCGRTGRSRWVRGYEK